MFTDVFCNCILYPGVFEGVKLGTGKVWERIVQEKKNASLSSTDIKLYNLIEGVCRKLAFYCTDDTIYAGCELLCNVWMRKRKFELEDIRYALSEAGIACSDLKNWKELLNQAIEANPELNNFAIQRKLDEILEALKKLHGSCRLPA